MDELEERLRTELRAVGREVGGSDELDRTLRRRVRRRKTVAGISAVVPIVLLLVGAVWLLGDDDEAADLDVVDTPSSTVPGEVNPDVDDSLRRALLGLGAAIDTAPNDATTLGDAEWCGVDGPEITADGFHTPRDVIDCLVFSTDLLADRVMVRVDDSEAERSTVHVIRWSGERRKVDVFTDSGGAWSARRCALVTEGNTVEGPYSWAGCEDLPDDVAEAGTDPLMASPESVLLGLEIGPVADISGWASALASATTATDLSFEAVFDGGGDALELSRSRDGSFSFGNDRFVNLRLADGLVVELNHVTGEVLMVKTSSTADELPSIPHTGIDFVLAPADRISGLASTNDVELIHLGEGVFGARRTALYEIRFLDEDTKYGGSWSLTFDVETGFLLAYHAPLTGGAVSSGTVNVVSLLSTTEDHTGGQGRLGDLIIPADYTIDYRDMTAEGAPSHTFDAPEGGLSIEAAAAAGARNVEAEE